MGGKSMREIKFRAWDKTARTFYFVSLLGDGWAHQPTDLEGHELSEWQQYTGLKDCSGVEIYEGDILHFTYWWFDGNEAEMPLTGEVVYVPEEASYGLAHIRSKEWLRHIGAQDTDEDTATFSGWQFSSDDIEVIGNIYEHGHLLKKGK